MTARHVFSVDFEDWYQGLEIDMDAWGRFETRIERGMDTLLNLLDAAKTKATFFVLGRQAELTPHLIAKLAAHGHEIGSHGYSHRFIYRQTPDTFRAELRRGKDAIEQAAQRKVNGFRAPFFSITNQSRWALDILAEEGFAYDSSLFPVVNYRYGIPDAPRTPGFLKTPAGHSLFEIPLSTVAWPGRLRSLPNIPMSGGGYFRMYPYWLTRQLIRHLEQQGTGLVFYVHPWEYDPHHPRIRLPRLVPTLTHYWNLPSMTARTARLLADFRFTTIAQAYPQALGNVSSETKGPCASSS